MIYYKEKELTRREILIRKRKAQRALLKKKAKNDLWLFCQLREPEYYKPEIKHLKIFCDTLQKLYEGKLIREDGKPYNKLIINYPPQSGKTRSLINFCMWVLGKNQEERIITCSYSDGTAWDFSRYTRDGISEQKQDPESIIFSDIFPEVKLAKDNKSYRKWSLENQFFSYLGAGPGGGITSKGGTIRIIDDLIKSAEIALNENALDKLFEWYIGTFLSRASGTPIDIINFTRWSKKDLVGRLEEDSEIFKLWYILKAEIYDEGKDEMLCESVMPRERYFEQLRLAKRTKAGLSIFRANYHQEPIDIKGQLYKDLKTYVDLPKNEDGSVYAGHIISYCDTAETGDNYTCQIIAMKYHQTLYIIDVLYDDLADLEEEIAKRLFKNKVNDATFESNAGGRSFAKNVRRILTEKLKSNYTIVHEKNQRKNKETRILRMASFVINNVLFPQNWSEKWPDFFNELYSYQIKGKNAFDDAADTITGLVELEFTNENIAEAVDW